MDSSMQNLLNGLLSNPESMKQVMQLVSSLGLANQAPTAPAAPVQAQHSPAQPAAQFTMPPPVIPQSAYQQGTVHIQQQPQAGGQMMSGQPYIQPAATMQEPRTPTPFDPIQPSQSAPAANANPFGISPEKAMEVLNNLQSSSKPMVEDNHMALISALKPFMRPARQSSLDGATKLLGAYRTFKGMGLKLF